MGVCFFVLRTQVSSARSLQITADKTQLSGDELLRVTASLSGFTDGENIRLKGAFFQPGSSNYFGWTKTDAGFVKNSEATANQHKVTVGQWDRTLDVRSDFTDSGFRGEGEYLLKIGFYYQTSADAYSGVQWSANTVSVTINEPDPTQTPSHTPTRTPTQTPACTPTPAPSPVPTMTPSDTPATDTPVPAIIVPPVSSDGTGVGGEAVLGAADAPSGSTAGIVRNAPAGKAAIVGCLSMGAACAVFSVAFALRRYLL